MTKVFGFVIVIFALIVTSTSINGQVPGGLGEIKAANKEVNQLVTRLTPEIIQTICAYRKENCPASDTIIIVNSYKTQLVGGLNYYISANLGLGGDTFHIKIFTQPWTNTEEVHRVLGPKQHTDEITYF